MQEQALNGQVAPIPVQSTLTLSEPGALPFHGAVGSHGRAYHTRHPEASIAKHGFLLSQWLGAGVGWGGVGSGWGVSWALPVPVPPRKPQQERVTAGIPSWS